MRRKISVIIPTMNRTAMLEKVLDSYKKNKPYEIIIVDDNEKPDKSLDKLGVIVIHNKMNKGLPASRNEGVLKATGDLVFFGEDDLELENGFFDKLLGVMERTKADAVCGRIVPVKDGKELVGNKLFLCFPTDVDFSCDLGKDRKMHTLTACALVKRELLIGKYQSKYGYNHHREETGTFVTLWHQRKKLIFTNKAKALHLKDNPSGGCRKKGLLWLEWGLFVNNCKFWSEHYSFLKKALKLKGFFLWYCCKYSAKRYWTWIFRS